MDEKSKEWLEGATVKVQTPDHLKTLFLTKTSGIFCQKCEPHTLFCYCMQLLAKIQEFFGSEFATLLIRAPGFGVSP
jgi:hypothetical protein